MTMTDSLDGLIERVERCTGPDRELDLALATALVPDVLVLRQRDDDSGSDPYTYWQYTGKIDDAVALAELKLPGWSWKLVHEGGRYTFVLRDAPRLEIVAPAWVHSREQPALAIILATLRALQSIKTSETPDK